MSGVGSKKQPGKAGRKLRKVETNKVSLKDLVARDPGRVKGGVNTQTHHGYFYVCA